MKTHRKSRRSTTNTLAFAAGLLAGALLLSTHVLAQAANPSGSASDKIGFYTDAITAEQSGDYAKAKDLLNKIIAMDPTDPGNKEVEAHIALLDQAMADSAKGKPTLFAANDAVSAAVMAPIVVTQLPADSSAPASSAAPSSAPAAAPAPAAAVPPTAEAAAAIKIEAQKQQKQLSDARAAIAEARGLEQAGQYDDARAKLAQAQQQLPPGLGSLYVAQEIRDEIANSYYNQSVDHYNTKAYAAAKDDLASYLKAGGDPARAQAMQDKITSAINNPMLQDASVVAPGFESKQDMIKQLLIKGEAEYILGDYTDAMQTFDTVITNDPDNIPAQAYEKKINEMLFDKSSISHDTTRAQFLKEVNDDWRLPSVYTGTENGNTGNVTVSPELKKLGEIVVPLVDIDIPTPLDEVVATFTMLAQKYDKDGKGLNFHVQPPPNGGAMPKVKLQNLRDETLEQLLNLACRDVNYGYFDDNGTIVVSQGSSSAMGMTGQFETKSFPMTESTQTRLLGYTSGSGDTSGGSTTPFSDSSSGGSSNGTAGNSTASSDAGSAPAPSDVEQRLSDFFQRAGIDFPSGARIAYTPGEIYVTNTPKNLEMLGNFLKKYSSVKQAEIEARFLDVSEGDLEQFGTNWNVASANGNTQLFQTSAVGGGNSSLRNIGSAFPLGNTGAQPTIVTGLSSSNSSIVPETTNLGNGTFETTDVTETTQVPLPNLTIPQAIPTLPNQINVGGVASNLFQGVLGYVEGYKLNFILTALSQKQGNDLMSAPKIVCMTEHDANITIAQQLSYPETFSPIQSQVSPASGSSGTASGSGGVTITAGTPNGFVTANIGVTMSVVPKIYEDDTIELSLSPVVTEFEGFIEYGGTSLAIQAGTTASVPSGFIQPIFDVRQINTDVTIFDGATVVLGGLTRDQVETVDDKVPVLGDIPLIGRLFQSKGETSQKRNLMIFVTANIISPGGAPANQSIANITPGAVFQNPTIVTPRGDVPRVPENALGAPAAPPQQ
jgi:general secretion pathway protein D